jgi:hypothetical protein
MHGREIMIFLVVASVLVFGWSRPSLEPTPGQTSSDGSSQESKNPKLADLRQLAPTVSIVYCAEDGSVGLRVTNGPSGCCLDADPRSGKQLV